VLLCAICPTYGSEVGVKKDRIKSTHNHPRDKLDLIFGAINEVYLGRTL